MYGFSSRYSFTATDVYLLTSSQGRDFYFKHTALSSNVSKYAADEKQRLQNMLERNSIGIEPHKIAIKNIISACVYNDDLDAAISFVYELLHNTELQQKPGFSEFAAQMLIALSLKYEFAIPAVSWDAASANTTPGTYIPPFYSAPTTFPTQSSSASAQKKATKYEGKFFTLSIAGIKNYYGASKKITKVKVVPVTSNTALDTLPPTLLLCWETYLAANNPLPILVLNTFKDQLTDRHLSISFKSENISYQDYQDRHYPENNYPGAAFFRKAAMAKGNLEALLIELNNILKNGKDEIITLTKTSEENCKAILQAAHELFSTVKVAWVIDPKLKRINSAIEAVLAAHNADIALPERNLTLRFVYTLLGLQKKYLHYNSATKQQEALADFEQVRALGPELITLEQQPAATATTEPTASTSAAVPSRSVSEIAPATTKPVTNNFLEAAETLPESEVESGKPIAPLNSTKTTPSAQKVETQTHLKELQEYLDNPDRLVCDLLCTTNQARQEAIAKNYAEKNPGGLANFLLRAHSNLAPALQTILITAVLKHLPQTSSYRPEIETLKRTLANNIKQTFFGNPAPGNSSPSAQAGSTYKASAK